MTEKNTQSVPQVYPVKNESGQDIEISTAFIDVVPKRGLEPLQAYTY
jgi:hypothetical protein